MKFHEKSTRQKLVDALWRARERMDLAESDAEYEARRQDEIVCRADLERYEWNNWRKVA